MAAAKRKQTSESIETPESQPKRFKKERNHDSKPKKSRFMDEAETDSDPIVESDTGSESGEDDGVSWPSDGEEDEALGVGSEADNETGTMDFDAKSSDASPAQEDVAKSSESPHQRLMGLKLTISQQAALEKLTRNRKLKSKNVKQPSPMRIRLRAQSSSGSVCEESPMSKGQSVRNW